MGRTILICIIAVGLLACRPARNQRSGIIPPADTPANPGEPASAPASSLAAEYAVPMDAGGGAPSWALKIRAGGISLSHAGHIDELAVNPGPKIEGQTAVWETASVATGAPLKVTLRPGDCASGMSDKAFPYQATVETDGGRLMGCAEPAAMARRR